MNIHDTVGVTSLTEFPPITEPARPYAGTLSRRVHSIVSR